MEKEFEEIFKHDLQNMDLRLTEMEEKITSIDTKLTQVVDALLGNPLTNKGGFNKEIEDVKQEMISIKKKVTDLEDFKKKVYWFISIAAVAFLVVQYISNIYSVIKQQ